jgi:prolyl-tRNA editing enzyme YbaK/EbsC (Cys-tRNA(Pro) deacylase)
MEESILKFESILINAGQRGTMLLMAPRDIKNGCGRQSCTYCEVTITSTLF